MQRHARSAVLLVCHVEGLLWPTLITCHFHGIFFLLFQRESVEKSSPPPALFFYQKSKFEEIYSITGPKVLVHTKNFTMHSNFLGIFSPFFNAEVRKICCSCSPIFCQKIPKVLIRKYNFILHSHFHTIYLYFSE